MHKVWFEWQLPAELSSLLGDSITALGPSTLTKDEPFSALPGAEAIIAASGLQYSDDVFALSDSLRAICRIGIGYDNVDVAAATRRGIVVCNTPDAPTTSTAEHAIALMLAVSKRIPILQARMRQAPGENHFLHNRAIELSGRTLGIVGFGRIGRRVANIARGLGMTIEVFDPHAQPDPIAQPGVTYCNTLGELLESADVVTLHLPLTDATRQMLDRAAFQRMKANAILINTSRGGLVDEAALVESLKSGHLFGAGLDVFGSEPPLPEHPLLQLDNVVATPHVASATDVSKAQLWTTAIRQAVDVLEGRRPPHMVNPDAWRPK